jgi:fructokinase
MTMQGDQPRLAGVELGGTNAVMVLGEGTRIVARQRFDVADPDETLSVIAVQLREWQPQALGIASFGPISVDPTALSYGTILTTTKPGWSDTAVLKRLAAAVDGPALIHTDVVGAALAEGRFGAARGCNDFVYITIGTGIGFGIIANGQPVLGTLHPEGGHLRVRRMPGDAFVGVCPFHGDCLEGLCSGPALGARFGDAQATSDDDPRWGAVVDALAEACASLRLLLAPQKIIFGGGVTAGRPWLPSRVAAGVDSKIATYLPAGPDNSITLAGLGTDAGAIGALILAESAYLTGVAKL